MTNSELLVNQGRILAGKIREQLGIPLGSYVDSASNSESKLPQSPNCDEPFVKATFESVLNRQPDLRELALSIEFLEQQRQLLAQANSAELSTKPVAGVIAASADIAQRARENLATSLFSHNDFVTIR